MSPSRSRNLATRVAFSLALVLSLVQVATAADAPTPLWSRVFTPTPIDTFNAGVEATEALTTPAGGVVMIGTFHGSVDFGGGAVVSSPWTDIEQTVDVYAASFDSLGEHTWSRVLARIRNNQGRALSIAIDGGGNLVVVGAFQSVDFGGTTLSSSFKDAFAAKFDPNGELLWSKKFGITGPAFGNTAEDVAIDADGNIIMVGSMAGRMDFGGGVIQSFSGEDVFLVKLNPDGGHVWSHRFGATGSTLEEGRLVALGGNGRITIAGRYPGGIDFGGGPLYGDYDEIFLATFDANASHVWSRGLLIGTPGGSSLTDLASSAAGDVAVTTNYSGSIDLGGEVLHGHGTVAARYDPTGTYRGARENVSAASFGGDESLVVSGSFEGTFDIGGTILTSAGQTDGYLARFDADGAFEWATQIGGSGYDGVGHAIRAGSDLWVFGGFDDGIDLGGVRYDGSATFLALFGVRPPAPVLDVSLFPSAGAIEVRWNITTEQPLDTLTILRGTPPAPIYTTPFGTGNGSFVDHDVVGGRKYQYQLVVTTPQGADFQSSVVTATAPALVFTNALAQNAPNPFNPTTSIAYSVSARADVVVEIYDVAGVRVRRIDEGVRDAGEYAVEWDGRDDAGNVVGTGVYFYRLEGVAGVAPKKMVLLK